MAVIFSVASKKFCLRTGAGAAGMFLLFLMQKQPRRGREYLVLAGNEIAENT